MNLEPYTLTVKEVSEVLYKLWDPININPLVTATVEYDDWSPEILEILKRGASAAEIADALDFIATEIGITPDKKRCRVTAEALVCLRVGSHSDS